MSRATADAACGPADVPDARDVRICGGGDPVLGAGGFGAVLCARRGAEELAVKVALGPLADLNVCEYDTGRRLRHPNLMPVLLLTADPIAAPESGATAGSGPLA